MYDRRAQDRADGRTAADAAAPLGPGKQTLVDQLPRAAAPGLRSPRFAGDATLEACCADRARLTTGARGAAVAKVQQALAELGYPIGAAGVDGVYGPALWDAVKQFKAREQLGWEDIGDVGPGTMRRLDALFSGAPPPGVDRPDRAEDGGQTSLADYVITRDDDADRLDGPQLPPAPEPGALLAMMMAQPDQPAVDTAATEPAGHLSILQAVEKFQSKLDVKNPAGKNLSAQGQFFWGRQVAAAVRAEIDAIRRLPDAGAFPIQANRAFDAVLNSWDTAPAALRAASAAASASKSPARPRMLALVHGFTTGGAALEAELWAALAGRSDDTLPDLSRYCSLVTLQTLRLFDKLACIVQVLRAAERVKQKGGLNARDPRVAPFAAKVSSGSGVRDRRPVNGGNKLLGDVVKQTGLSSVVKGLKAALDAGQMIHARVLSGVGVGTADSVPAEPGARPMEIAIPDAGEHSILIIGYDNDAFVFNDPDAGQSIQPAPGFGTLHYDGVRLSTAIDDADLPVTATGNHAVGDHRYQVLSLTAV